MNEPEKDRILEMVSAGILRPDEAVGLLAALTDETKPTIVKKAEPEKKAEATSQKKANSKEPLMEVQMQRADGSSYTVQVPPNLVPLFWNIAKVAVKESARTAAQETWSGFKHIVKRKSQEVGSSVKNKVTSITSGSKKVNIVEEPEDEGGIDKFEARRQLLQMVVNGRISASDAGRLIEQLDALDVYVKAQPGTR